MPNMMSVSVNVISVVDVSSKYVCRVDSIVTVRGYVQRYMKSCAKALSCTTFGESSCGPVVNELSDCNSCSSPADNCLCRTFTFLYTVKLKCPNTKITMSQKRVNIFVPNFAHLFARQLYTRWLILDVFTWHTPNWRKLKLQERILQLPRLYKENVHKADFVTKVLLSGQQHLRCDVVVT